MAPFFVLYKSVIAYICAKGRCNHGKSNRLKSFAGSHKRRAFRLYRKYIAYRFDLCGRVEESAQREGCLYNNTHHKSVVRSYCDIHGDAYLLPEEGVVRRGCGTELYSICIRNLLCHEQADQHTGFLSAGYAYRHVGGDNNGACHRLAHERQLERYFDEYDVLPYLYYL